MNDLSKETKIEIACKMVIIDAIEKGHTTVVELIQYMNSKVFKKAVKNYVLILNEA